MILEPPKPQPAFLTPVALFARLQPAVVAIDGPAASGKSTIGHRLAELTNYLFFDTGVLYRAVTWAVLERGIDIRDANAVSILATHLTIDVAAPAASEQDGRQSPVLVDGRDVTWAIRTPQVDQNVSVVSAYPAVRQALSVKQRQIGQRYGSGQAEKAGVIMVGRDIGTIVMPEAALKFYIDASPEERARRRYVEQVSRGKTVVYEEILADLRRRDQLDSERAYAPLRAAADAIVIDTSALSLDEVIAQLLAATRQQLLVE